MSVQFQTALVGFIFTIAGVLISEITKYFSDRRHRRWTQEDAHRQRKMLQLEKQKSYWNDFTLEFNQAFQKMAIRLETGLRPDPEEVRTFIETLSLKSVELPIFGNPDDEPALSECQDGITRIFEAFDPSRFSPDYLRMVGAQIVTQNQTAQSFLEKQIDRLSEI
jgi:hypothetical protein